MFTNAHRYFSVGIFCAFVPDISVVIVRYINLSVSHQNKEQDLLAEVYFLGVD